MALLAHQLLHWVYYGIKNKVLSIYQISANSACQCYPFWGESILLLLKTLVVNVFLISNRIW